MMPHPERASDPMLGGTDGMKLFQGLLATVRASEGSCIGAKILELIILEPVSLSLSDF